MIGSSGKKRIALAVLVLALAFVSLKESIRHSHVIESNSRQKQRMANASNIVMLHANVVDLTNWFPPAYDFILTVILNLNDHQA